MIVRFLNRAAVHLFLGGNFANILWDAFANILCQKTQTEVEKKLQVTLSHRKASRKMFAYLFFRCQFHPHFTSSFFVQKSFFTAFLCLKVCICNFFCEKASRKMLVKLTTDLSGEAVAINQYGYAAWINLSTICSKLQKKNSKLKLDPKIY